MNTRLKTSAAKRSGCLVIEYRSTSALRPSARNPRTHSDRQIDQIGRSIRTFGFNSPIAVDANGNVVAGHGRLEAAKRLGLETVPVVCLDHLSPAQAKAFLIADNRIAELAAWNRPLLVEVFDELQREGLTLEIDSTGFEVGEIDLLFESARPADDPDDDVIPEQANTAPTTQIGDFWNLGDHRLLCGDALDSASYDRLLGGNKVAAIFADPPYNVRVASVAGLGQRNYREFAMGVGEMSSQQFTHFLGRAFERMVRSSAPGAVHFITMDWRHIEELLAAARDVYDAQLNLCVWTKPSAGMGSLYRSSHELVFVFRAGRSSHRNNIQLGKFGRNRSNVWSYPSPRGFGGADGEAEFVADHPTPKPVALIADALMDVTARGDLVLDPFLGSGSTLIAAERVGRVGHGIELDPGYVDLAIRRWQHLTGKEALHASSGKTFASLTNERTSQ